MALGRRRNVGPFDLAQNGSDGPDETEGLASQRRKRTSITVEPFERLGSALAIGFLIGTERGWRARDVTEGGRAAGLRTYALSGPLGGAPGC